MIHAAVQKKDRSSLLCGSHLLQKTVNKVQFFGLMFSKIKKEVLRQGICMQLIKYVRRFRTTHRGVFAPVKQMHGNRYPDLSEKDSTTEMTLTLLERIFTWTWHRSRIFFLPTEEMLHSKILCGKISWHNWQILLYLCRRDNQRSIVISFKHNLKLINRHHTKFCGKSLQTDERIKWS